MQHPARIGRHDIIGLLGDGSFASVYLAHDPSLDADVAIKLLASRHAGDHDLRSRFVDEARALQEINSDRVVAVHDIGEHEGLPYVVMEHVSGGTLEDRLQAREAAGIAPAPEDIERLVTQLAEGLAVIHSANLVHRDIKPSNLLIHLGDLPPDDRLLAHDERLVVGDFGLAHRTAPGATGATAWSDGYSAPELRTAAHGADGRTDVHAAGAVVGRAAFGPRWRAMLVTDPATGATLREPAGSEPLTFELRRSMSPRASDRHTDITDWSESILASFEEATAPPTPPAGRRNGRRLAAAGLVVVSMLATAGVLSGTQTSVEAPVVTALSSAVGEPNGPDIAGPSEVPLGSLATFSHASRAGAEYQWIAPEGAAVDRNTISYAPGTSDDFEITLIETIGGLDRTTTRTIRVLNA